jgi:predicted RNase H-like HicB family nuclease
MTGVARAPLAVPWERAGKEHPVKRTIQVRIFRGEKQYVAECLDLPVVTEAPTLDELAANIREAIALHLEGEDLAELGVSKDATILATMELEAVA